VIRDLSILTACTLAVSAAVVPATPACRQQAAAPAAATADATPTRAASPARARLAAAETHLDSAPADPEALAAFAAACVDVGRLTADAAWYQRAEAAIGKALAADPGSYQALRLRAWVLGGQHRFADSAAAARQAMAREPRDPWNYGTLCDALVETGDYDGAETACQTMLDLQPALPAFARAAHLRELFGDTQGAMEMMTLALRAADPRDPEQQAWCLTQRGHLHWNSGDAQAAQRDYDSALAKAPASAEALAGAARVAALHGEGERAESLRAHAIALIPAAGVVAESEAALTAAGRVSEARDRLALLEGIAGLERQRTGIFDRQTALALADRRLMTDEALASARREITERKDIYGWDALAWTALSAGDVGEARAAIVNALSLGTRDARLRYHAGMIALAAGDSAAARAHLMAALDINPAFDRTGAERARAALSTLHG